MIQLISDVLFGHIQKYRMVAVESDIESVLASARESAEKRAYSLENFEEMKKALYNMRLNSQCSPISESPSQDTLILKFSSLSLLHDMHANNHRICAEFEVFNAVICVSETDCEVCDVFS